MKEALNGGTSWAYPGIVFVINKFRYNCCSIFERRINTFFLS